MMSQKRAEIHECSRRLTLSICLRMYCTSTYDLARGVAVSPAQRLPK